MSKIVKIVLIISLLLNVGLAVGFWSYKSYVTTKSFELAALTARAEASLLKSVLSELESDDPEKIAALKERLRRHIEGAQKSEEIWQRAAEK